MKLNETIEFYIRTTSLALSRMYGSIASRYGITQSIGYLLTYVEREGTPSTKLARQLGMKNSSLTRLLKNMEANGCIYRKVDPKDKRVVRIFLTEKGVQKRKVAKETVLNFNKKILKKVNQKDLETFFRVFDVIKEQVALELNEQSNVEHVLQK